MYALSTNLGCAKKEEVRINMKNLFSVKDVSMKKLILIIILIIICIIFYHIGYNVGYNNTINGIK